MGDLGEARPRRLRPAFHRAGHKSDVSAWFEHVEHRLGHPFPVGPVERLAEGHQPERAKVEFRDLLRQGLDPLDIGYPSLSGVASRLGKHVDIGVQANDLADKRGEFDAKHTGTAADVEQSSGAGEAALRGDRLAQS